MNKTFYFFASEQQPEKLKTITGHIRTWTKTKKNETKQRKKCSPGKRNQRTKYFVERETTNEQNILYEVKPTNKIFYRKRNKPTKYFVIVPVPEEMAQAKQEVQQQI